MRIGIDLGGTKTEGVVMDNNGEIIARLRRPTPHQDGYSAILENIQSIVLGLESEVGETCTVGIGTPGSLSPETGLLRNSNTVCMNGKPALTDLQALLDREIRMANDANCFTLSEAVDGAGKDATVVFGIIIGTGTGGGVVVNQQIITGAQSIGGEWGHNPLGNEGRRCFCGRADCVETYLCGSGLITTWKQAGGQGSMTPKKLVEQAKQGDAIALRALEYYYHHFGRAVASVVNILDPDVVVLGGGLSNIDSLTQGGFQALKPHVFSDCIRTRIVKNLHGDSSGVRGAAWLWG